MSRKKQAPIRKLPTDPLYNSVLITRMINKLMIDGKRSIAERIFYKALDLVATQTKQNPLEVFEKALENIGPLTEVRSRRVGGSNYQVPVDVSSRRRTTLSLRWLIIFSRKRPEKTMELRLAREMIDAANQTGASVKKRTDTHKMAEANKAFAHFKW